MEVDQKTTPVAILSDGEKSFSLYSGITKIGRDQNKGQHIQLGSDDIDSRHAVIRINTGETPSAEIIDLFSDYGTKIEEEIIPSGEWRTLETDKWVTFGQFPLKFSFVPTEDQSEVISSSPEPTPIRRRYRSMLVSSQASQCLEANVRRSMSLTIVESSQVNMTRNCITSLDPKPDQEEGKTDDEEIIPETQQDPSSKHNDDEDDSEFVFVESETQSRLDPSYMMSQICPVVDESMKLNVTNHMIIEGSVDGSMNLQLDITPSQKERKQDQEIPDIFKDTEEEPNEGLANRDDSVTPDLDEIEPAALTSLASTESKTNESTLEEDVNPDDIYNAATQKFNPITDNADKIGSYDSDEDIFLASTQKFQDSPKKTSDIDNIYEVATQQLDPTLNRRDDNIYDALTQVVPREYLNIPPTPVAENLDPRPPSRAESEDSDTDFATAPTMVVNSQNPRENNGTPDESCFFQTFTQLSTPEFINKFPKPIQVKEEDDGSPRREVVTPQASSTAIKRKEFQVPSSKPLKKSPFTHLNDSPSQLMDLSDVNTPDFMDLPPKQDLVKQVTDLDSKKKSKDKSYFFEGSIDLTDTQTPETEKQVSRTRETRNRPNETKNEAPKKPERRLPRPKPPSALKPPSEPLKRPDSSPSSSRESRKRHKPSKLAQDFVTESQMDDYDIEEPPKHKITMKSPLQDKNEKPKPKEMRQLKVVVKPVATVATALPVTISPPKSRKRKGTKPIDFTPKEEETAPSPPKLRKVKTDVSSDAGNSSNEALAKLERSKSAMTKRKREVKIKTEPVKNQVIRTRSRDNPKQKILFTMVSGGPYETAIKNAGHSLADSIEEATVLVTDKVYRSAKFLSAIAKGIPIVSVSWLENMKSNLEMHLIYDTASEDKYRFSLRRTLDDVKANGAILKDYLIICSPNTRPFPHEIKQIVKSAGGKFSDKIKDLTGKKVEKCLIVAVETDKNFIKDAKKTDSNFHIINGEAFMLTVIRNELVFDNK